MPIRFLLFLIPVIIAYWPAQQGGYLWDDDDYILNNPQLKSSAGLGRIWTEPGATPQFYPLVFTSFWIEYHLWMYDTMGYHLVNIVLHALNSWLLWLILRRLEIPGAWLAAAIFALHPVHVESVAWMTERKNVLSGFFYLLSFLAFLRFAPLPPFASARHSSWWYAVCLVTFVAALLSKTVTCSLPAVLVLVYWWKRGRLTRREWSALAPMFVLGAALAWNTARLEGSLVGAQGEAFAFTPVERCLIAGRALWFYVQKLLVPYPLIFNYERWHIDSHAAWQYLYPLGVGLVFGILLAGQRRFGRGPLVACLIFAGTLLPALGFFNVYPMLYSFVADHFQYLASIPLIVLFVVGMRRLGERLNVRPIRGMALGMLLLGGLGYLTWDQCHDYVNMETLWRHTLAKNPNSFLAEFRLGVGYQDIRQYAEAIPYFERAAKINPRYAPALGNWGTCLAVLGEIDKGRAQHAENEAAQLQKQGRQRDADIRAAAAKAFQFAASKKFAEALAKARMALELENDDPRRYNNVAITCFVMGDFEASARWAQQALDHVEGFERYDRKRFDFKKGYPQAEYWLGRALMQMKRVQEALPHLRRAAELAPNSQTFQQALETAEEMAQKK